MSNTKFKLSINTFMGEERILLRRKKSLKVMLLIAEYGE